MRLNTNSPITTATLVLTLLVGLLGSACSKHSERARKKQLGAAPAGAIISIDGSSTVFPITEAVAEEFQKGNKSKVTIGVSGTGGGFKKFCKGEVALTGASRPIKQSEVALCEQAGIEYVELPIAYDGIAIAVHKQNDWVTSLTVDELRRMWEPHAQAKVTKWNQIRAEWPDAEIHLFGPGVDSGTYDYFTLAIVGKEHHSRGDFTSSEDDNVLVQGVSSDKVALGFFGFAYYAENQDKLKLVPVDDGDPGNGAGPIAPSVQTVADGTYQPLARPIFLYVRKKAAEGPDVENFVSYYLTKGAALVRETGYIPLGEKAYQLVLDRFERRVTGSAFVGHGSQVGATVEELLDGK